MNPARLRSVTLILFWLALVAAVTLAVMPYPPHMPTDALGDKFNHMLAFSVMAGLAALAWPQTPRWKVVGRLSLLGALIEIVQAIPALHRDCDIRDWIADTTAIIVVTGIAAVLMREKATGRGQ